MLIQLESRDPIGLERQLLELATRLGTPVPTRGRTLVDRLIPQQERRARTSSLSAITGLAEQPWHIDLAHHQVPVHYIVLACESEGSSPVPTNLVSWKNVIDIADHDACCTEPFLVRNGAASFFATLLTRWQQFFRFDPGCMQPMTRGGKALMSKICSKRIDPAARIDWRPRLTLVIDNWRMLHRRQDAHGAQDRVILRVSVMGG